MPSSLSGRPSAPGAAARSATGSGARARERWASSALREEIENSHERIAAGSRSSPYARSAASIVSWKTSSARSAPTCATQKRSTEGPCSSMTRSNGGRWLLVTVTSVGRASAGLREIELDLDPVVVERRAAAHIRVALRDRRVDVAPGPDQLRPLLLVGERDARPARVVDDRLGTERSSVVAHAPLRAGLDSAPTRVERMQVHTRRAEAAAVPRQRCEGGVEHVARGGGEQRERISLCELDVLELVRRHVADERVGALLRELGREQAQAPAGGREATLREACDARNRHAQRTLVQQALERDLGGPRRVAVEHVARHLLVRFAQARVIEAERGGEPPEDLGIREALAGRADRR